MSWDKRHSSFEEPKKNSELRECCAACVDNDVSCPIKECKNWIDYEDDLNCCLISIEKNGRMTLREIADRLKVSFVRVKQIQDKGLKKLSKLRNKTILKTFE
jgi:hypothetical protein